MRITLKNVQMWVLNTCKWLGWGIFIYFLLKKIIVAVILLYIWNTFFSLTIFTFQMVHGRCHHTDYKEFIHRIPQDAFVAFRNQIYLWKCMISKKSIDIWHVIMNSRVYYYSKGNSSYLRLHFRSSHAIITQCFNLMSLVLCSL